MRIQQFKRLPSISLVIFLSEPYKSDLRLSLTELEIFLFYLVITVSKLFIEKGSGKCDTKERIGTNPAFNAPAKWTYC